MRDIFELYQYIKNKYHNYQKIEYTDTEIIIVFHDELEMKIIVQNYYNLDWQDVKDAIDDIFTNQYAFCEQKGKLKVIYLNDYHESKDYKHVWTIEKILK